MAPTDSLYTRVFGLLLATVAVVYGGLILLFSLLGNPFAGGGLENPLAEVRGLVERIRAENLLDPARRRDLDALLAGYRDSRLFFRLSVIDRRFTVIASTEESLRDTPEGDAFVRHAFERGRTYPVKTRFGEVDVEQEAHPIAIGGTIEAVLLAARHLGGGVPLPELAPAASRFSVRLFLLLCLILALVIAFYINRFFRRLSTLSGAVSNLARGDYRARVPLSPDSELGVLAESFNRIAEDKERQARETSLLNRVLEQSNREKERHLRTLAQVAGGMAHEVRNPLGGIRGFAELLKLELDRAGTPPGDKRYAYVESILGEVRALEHLVQSVLDFARPKMPAFSPTPVDLLVEAVRPAIERRGLDLAEGGTRIDQAFEIDPGLPPLEVDPGQMRQMLLNLSLNALEAMEGTGGAFTLAARRARPEERALLPPGVPADRTVAVLEIRDTGEGMDAEQRDALFTPFHTTKARGTGLGLPVCQKIVEIHGGAIRVASEKGRGTAFTVVIPASRGPR